jgi:hypothetical protein
MTVFSRARARAFVLVCAIAVLIALPAAAAESSSSGIVAAAAATVLPVLLSFALNPATWGVVAGLIYILTIRGHAMQAKVDQAISAAFYVVEDLKQQGKLPGYADKPRVALEKLKEILDTQGITWKDEIGELAKVLWSSMHGASNHAAAAQAVQALADAVKPKA